MFRSFGGAEVIAAVAFMRPVYGCIVVEMENRSKKHGEIPVRQHRHAGQANTINWKRYRCLYSVDDKQKKARKTKHKHTRTYNINNGTRRSCTAILPRMRER